jgi:hypothetical protein
MTWGTEYFRVSNLIILKFSDSGWERQLLWSR